MGNHFRQPRGLDGDGSLPRGCKLGLKRRSHARGKENALSGTEGRARPVQTPSSSRSATTRHPSRNRHKEKERERKKPQNGVADGDSKKSRKATPLKGGPSQKTTGEKGGEPHPSTCWRVERKGALNSAITISQKAEQVRLQPLIQEKKLDNRGGGDENIEKKRMDGCRGKSARRKSSFDLSSLIKKSGGWLSPDRRKRGGDLAGGPPCWKALSGANPSGRKGSLAGN